MNEKSEREAESVEDQAVQAPEAEDSMTVHSSVSASRLAAIIKSDRKRRRREWIGEKIRSSRIFWFFNPQAEDPRLILRSRPTLDRAKYERFRSLVSWTHIARLQSSYAVKLGLTGLVFAPLMATAFLYIPYLKNFGFPRQFGFLFLSGLSFVLSALLFRLRCPVLLLEMLSRTTHVRDSLRRKDVLEALVSMEFASLVTWRRYPADLALLMPEGEKDKLAAAMIANGWDPALAGYGPRQFGMIERAIYEFASRRNIKVWMKEFNRQEKRIELRPGYGPRITYEGARPYVVRLHISKPDHNILERQAEVCKNDLVLEWHETHLDDASRLPKTADINVSISYAEGLHHLFSSDDAAETFALIISRWQEHRRGMSRLGMYILYSASIVLFASFLWLQTRIVLKALGWL